MPILSAEPMIFPVDLLQIGEERVATGDIWWAMHTLARREKELMRRLRSMEIAHYCPLIKRRTKSPAGRVRVSHVPLFSGYVFVLGTELHRYKAMTTNCVARCLQVGDPLRLLFDLRQIQRLIEIDAPLTPEARIQPGRRVRVRSGPMMGLEGVVLKRRGKDRLMVALEFLSRGASVLLEDYHLECV